MKQFYRNMHQIHGKVIVVVFLAAITLLIIIIGSIAFQITSYHSGLEYIIKTSYDLKNIRVYIQQNENKINSFSLQQEMQPLLQNTDSVKPISNRFPILFFEQHSDLKQKINHYRSEIHKLDSILQVNNQLDLTVNYYSLLSYIQQLQNEQKEVKATYNKVLTTCQKYLINTTLLIIILIIFLGLILHLRIKHLKNNYATTQKNLQSKENDLRITLESISDGIIVTNRRGEISLINQAAAQLTGYDMDVAIKTTLPEIFNVSPHTEDDFIRKTLLEQIEESCDTGLTNQAILHSKNGLHYQITYSASWIEKPGALHFGIVIIFRDESEQFKMLEMLQRNETNLATAEKLAQLGSWEYDIKTKVMFWSDEVYRIFRVDDMSFEPSYQQFINLIHPDDQTVVKKYFNQQHFPPGKQSVDVRILPGHGPEKIVRIRFDTVVNKSLQVVRLVGSIQDITEISDLYKLIKEEFNLRSQSEDMIKSVKKQYQILFHNLPDMIFRVDENLICIAANRSFRYAYQLNTNDYHRKHINQLPISKNLKEKLTPYILQVFYDGDKRFYRAVHKIQNQKHFSKISIIPEKRDDEIRSVYVVIGRGRKDWRKKLEIMDMKKEINLLAQKHQRRVMTMENILRREKKRKNNLRIRFDAIQAELFLQKDIMDAIPYPVYFINTKNVLIHANLAFSQILEYQDVSQILGKNIYDILPKHFAELIDINHLSDTDSGNFQFSKLQLANQNRNTKNIISFRKKINSNLISKPGMVGAIIFYDK